MNANNTLPSNIDEYIARFPKETQELLELLRSTIKNAAPEATETISYQMPAFKLYGNLVYFAGYISHIGFYPGAACIDIFKDEIVG
ncbi:MAG: iron chaperone, partial [Paludibacter sp.]